MKPPGTTSNKDIGKSEYPNQQNQRVAVKAATRFLCVPPAWRDHLEVQVLFWPGRGNG